MLVFYLVALFAADPQNPDFNKWYWLSLNILFLAVIYRLQKDFVKLK